MIIPMKKHFESKFYNDALVFKYNLNYELSGGQSKPQENFGF